MIIKYDKGVFGAGKLSQYVIWYPLEGNKKCEISDCTNIAFKVCDNRIEICCFIDIWVGCGRRICKEHLDYNIHKRYKRTVEFYRCTEQCK
jgi:hypothetical protein